MTTSHNDDIVDVLLGQHEQLRQLFSALRDAQARDGKAMLRELAQLLLRHEIGEQAVVHRAVHDVVRGGNTTGAACASEEDQIVRALAELMDLVPGHPAFETTLTALHQSFLDHAAHEERDEFPRLRRYVTKQSLYMMAYELHDVQAMR
jgi:Hemerythrin HHE cation binding domain